MTQKPAFDRVAQTAASSGRSCLIFGDKGKGTAAAFVSAMDAAARRGRQVVCIAGSGFLPLECGEDQAGAGRSLLCLQTRLEDGLPDGAMTSPGRSLATAAWLQNEMATETDRQSVLPSDYAAMDIMLRSRPDIADQSASIHEAMAEVESALPAVFNANWFALDALNQILPSAWGRDAFCLLDAVATGEDCLVDIGAGTPLARRLVAGELAGWLADAVRGRSVTVGLEGCSWSPAIGHLMDMCGSDPDFADVELVLHLGIGSEMLEAGGNEAFQSILSFASRCSAVNLVGMCYLIGFPGVYQAILAVAPCLEHHNPSGQSLWRYLSANDVGERDLLEFTDEGMLPVLFENQMAEEPWYRSPACSGAFGRGAVPGTPDACADVSEVPGLEAHLQGDVSHPPGGFTVAKARAYASRASLVGAAELSEGKDELFIEGPGLFDTETDGLWDLDPQFSVASQDTNAATAGLPVQVAPIPAAAPAPPPVPSPAPLLPSTERGMVAVPLVGNARIGRGTEVTKEFAPLTGVRLPLADVPDLQAAAASLEASVPHARAVADGILTTLSGRESVWLRPYLLVGPPGCGKTTFACQLAETLGLPSELVSCGGASDSSFAGTPRQWSTGGPSLPLSLMLRHVHASPAIILDELDKAGTSRNNGNLADALGGMLEPRTAARWHDPYLQAEIDLTGVVWIATANRLEDVPRVLRDRFEVVEFPVAGTEHVAALSRRMLAELCAARRLNPGWAVPLDETEMAVLARTWRGGSLRQLARLTARLFDLRGTMPGTPN